MTLWEAILLGVVQGATEFLPISSSGHAVLVPAVLGLPAPSLALIVVAHLGTLLAVVLYFWRDLVELAGAALVDLARGQPLARPASRLAWLIVLGSVPAAVGGFFLESWLEPFFVDPRWAALFLLGTAGLLIWGEWLLSGRKELPQMTWNDALFIGLFQMLALLPGLSRSGSTITAGLLRGLNRELAARFSFLLSVPVIFGAGLVQLPDLLGTADLGRQLPLILGIFLASAAVGFLCIHLLLRWLQRRTLYPFAAYCATVGLVFLLLATWAG